MNQLYKDQKVAKYPYRLANNAYQLAKTAYRLAKIPTFSDSVLLVQCTVINRS